MQQFGNFRNVLLEDSDRIRVRHHQSGDRVVHGGSKRVHVNRAVPIRLDLARLEARDRRGRGIGSVR